MGDATPTLTVDGLRKEYGAVTALDGVDLSLDGPGILGVAGPNGSGKTTLIHAVLGLVSPTAGDVRVDGTAPSGFDASDRTRFGYMPQHAAVYDDLTVRENVGFFASLYDVEDRRAAVDRALGFVGLEDRADSRITALSGGMVRRTSLACAVVHEPDLLFLDEPTVGLDPELRAAMWDGFRERRDDGARLVVSTHYLEEVKHCDGVCFLRGDRRTLAMVLVLPAFVLYLFSEVFPRPEPVAPVVLAVVVFLLTYLLTAVGFLRERTAGTLERVLVAPVSRSGLVLGYVCGYGVLAAVQSLVLLVAAVAFMNVEFAHGIAPFVAVELLGALTALGIGIVLSLFADSEFQAIQFVPLVITPQVVLGGTFLPVEELPTYLEWPARAMPVTYLVDAMRYVVNDSGTAGEFRVSVVVLVAFAVLSVLAAGAKVRRTG